MKFGVRQCANVVFKAKSAVKIGNMVFKAGQPVLYIDTATTTSMEGAATTVYAQGGRGNSRLIAWEGQKTLTFSVTDALLSPIGMAILTGAGLIHNDGNNASGGTAESNASHANQHVHMTAYATFDENGTAIDLSDSLGTSETICTDAPVFIIKAENDGSLTNEVYTNATASGQKLTFTTAPGTNVAGTSVFVDFYVDKRTQSIYEMQIDAENFAGYYYVEADTLFRDQATGKDLPANLTFPNVKIQSNFTFSMAGTGDPSTFEFKMDAFPGYTMFDKTKKVLCVIQVINEAVTGSSMNDHTVMPTDSQNTNYMDEDNWVAGSTAFDDSIAQSNTDTDKSPTA